VEKEDEDSPRGYGRGTFCGGVVDRLVGNAGTVRRGKVFEGECEPV